MQARHRAAPRLLDAARGLHGKRRDHGEAALRETLEEANARVEIGDLFSMLSVPHVNQVHMFYRARLLDLDFAPGTESLEVALFEEAEIPWKEIAFRTISTTLRHYLRRPQAGALRLPLRRMPV